MQSINIHVGLNIAISVLATCTFMFRQVCTIELSLFKTTTRMHRRPFEACHLVFLVILFFCSLQEMWRHHTVGRIGIEITGQSLVAEYSKYDIFYLQCPLCYY